MSDANAGSPPRQPVPDVTRRATRRARVASLEVVRAGASWLGAILVCAPACTDRPLLVSCRDCGIQLEHTATLGSSGGPGALSSIPSAAARDSRGRFYVVTPQLMDEAPFVFDREGRFLQQLGRVGSGPGEYRRPAAVIVTAGDTIHLADQALARLTVLAPTYDVVRTVTGIPSTYDFVHLADGSYVVNNSASADLRSLHRFDAEGAFSNAFDPGSPSRRRDQSWRNTRWLAPSGESGLWSVTAFFDYTITRWDADGTKQQEFSIAAPWFPPYDRLSAPSTERPPMPEIHGAWADDSGRLWIVGHTGASNWERGLGEPRWAEGQWYNPVEDYGEVYESVIEVRDAGTGALLSERHLPGSLGRLLVIAPGVLGGRRETIDGWWLVDVWEVTYESAEPGEVSDSR